MEILILTLGLHGDVSASSASHSPAMSAVSSVPIADGEEGVGLPNRLHALTSVAAGRRAARCRPDTRPRCGSPGPRVGATHGSTGQPALRTSDGGRHPEVGAAPPAQGATEPTKCPLCADKYYTSGAMLEHLAWHAVHAAAAPDDKETASNILQGRARRSPWHAPYARRPPPQAADHANGDEEAPEAAPGTGGAAQQGSIPAGLAPLALLWAPLGTGSPHPMAPAHPGALAAPADPAAMPMQDG